jgi:hypothetical protein
MSRNNVKREPYCKVCHDAGKLESEYRSHWVKDLKGNTVCPTLLNTECRYCYKLGHTAKFCQALEKNKKNKEKAERRSEYVSLEKPVKQSTTKRESNKFAALQEDSGSDSEIKVSIKPTIVVEEYPILGTISKNIEVPQHEATIGWAAIAAKPKKEEPVDPIHTGMNVLKAKNRIKPAVKTEKKQKSWADWSDSDNEEEEDDEPSYQPFDDLEDW